jgi:hypothetical protein
MPLLLAPVPVFQLTVSSSGTSKGVAQTRGPQFVGRGELASGPFYVGAYIKNVTSSSYGAQAGALVGVRATTDGFSIALSATLKCALDPVRGYDSKAFELAASVGRNVGRFTPLLSVNYSPDDLGPPKRSVYVEGGTAYALSKRVSLSAAIGRRDRVNGTSYTAWNAGLTWTPDRHFLVAARYYETDRSSSWPYGPRFVTTGTLKF